MRRATPLSLIAAAAIVVALLGIGVAASGKPESDQSFLAGLVSRALSTPATQVHIGSVDGALSSDATIHDIAISDRDGVWLKLDRARLKWRRTALLLRRLEVDSLEIGHLEIRRRPLPSDQPVKDADQPLLPALPVKVQIKQFALSDLDLGQPVLGTALRATASGTMELGSPAEGLVFNLDTKRIDSAGTFTAALTYVPQGDALSVKVALDEPSGGLISKLAHLAGDPPVSFNLAGRGTLNAFKAALDFQAGTTIDAKGAIDLQRRDTGRDLGVEVAGHLARLLPASAAPIFEGETKLTSGLRIADDGAVALNELSLSSRLARLDAHGTYGTDAMLDFVSSIRAVANDGDVSKAGAATIRKLVFDGTIKGPVKAPHVAATLALAGARLPEGSLETFAARFTATPSGDVTDDATRIALHVSAEATGVVPRDPALSRALGGGASFVFDGIMDTQGEAVVQHVEARTPTLVFAYAGDLGRTRVHGRMTGSAPDLSRFGDLAGLHLVGAATLGIDINGVPKAETMTAAVTADVQDFATGLAAVDRLMGHHVTVKGGLAMAPHGLYRINDLVLAGAHASAHFAGSAAAAASDLSAHVTLPDLSQADAKLTGTATLDARLGGGLDKPDVSLNAVIETATAMGRAVPHLALVASISDLRGAAATHIAFDGSVDGKPAQGLVEAARSGGDEAMAKRGWDLSALDITVGSVTLKGSGALDDSNLARGSVSLKAGNLDDLSAFALTRLGGSLGLDATLAAPDGRQDVHVNGQGADLRAAGAAVRRFAMRVDAQDVLRHPVLDADATVDKALIGGQTISAVRFSARGAASQSVVKLSARAAGFDLDAAGAVVPEAATRLALASFSARRGTRKIELSGPADLILADGGVAIRHLALNIAGGRLAVDGRAGKNLDLSIDARAIPLAAADIIVPSLGLGGTLDATVKIAGSSEAPAGPYRVSVRNLTAPQTRAAGLPSADILASGHLDRQRASLDAKIAAGRAGTLTVGGSLPLDAAGSVDLAVHGKLDAAIANASLGTSGRSVSGSVLLDAKLAGTRDAPKVAGSATLNGGTFRDSLLGVRFDAIEGRLVAQGDRISIERLSAATPNAGVLSATGQVRIDPAAGFPGTVALRGQHATLVSSSLITATADLAINVSGALARNPRVGGKIEVTHVDVGIPDRLPATLKPIDGVRHVNAPPLVAARLAQATKKAAGAGTKGRPALFDAALDVTVSAPNSIFLRGRGVDAELGGDLHVIGTTNKPVPNGSFDLRRGKIAALGKTLTFTKGKLTFTGDFVPELDFAAEIQATDITAQIEVTGPAATPVFAFTSQPDLPQDEILSRVLFDKASGSLSGFQALQLAQAAAQFSSGGDDAFEKLRKSLGVDSLQVQGDQSGPSVGISRAISDRVSIGVRTGATADQTGVSADIDVTKHIRAQSDVRSNGSTSVGVGSEIEY